jgi:hypothetical protein
LDEALSYPSERWKFPSILSVQLIEMAWHKSTSCRILYNHKQGCFFPDKNHKVAAPVSDKKINISAKKPLFNHILTMPLILSDSTTARFPGVSHYHSNQKGKL